MGKPVVVIFFVSIMLLVILLGSSALYGTVIKPQLQQCHSVTIDDQFSVFTDVGLTDKVVIDSTVYTLAYDEASIGNRSVSLRGQTWMARMYGDVVVVC